MTNPHTWEQEIIEVLQELGGEAHYSDIYQKIEEREVMDLSSSWKSVVRGCIERFSSDSEVYQKGNRDNFYSVDGINNRIGNGCWGLRNYEEDTTVKNLTEDDLGFPEGKNKLRIHISKERNPKVVREAKKRFKAEHERLYCEICRFDFEKKYGIIGEDFIEGHHTIPVSEMKEGEHTRIEDIALVCSNCHRMLHRKRPWLTKEALQGLIDK